MSKSLKMILIADKRKVMTKSHNEFLDIMDYLFFHNTFIYILIISNADFLYIYKIKNIRILEHIYSLDRGF